eukprot:6472501-Amphidinium_carterae.1
MKLRGGLTSAWIGYEFDLKELGVGISASKVEWVTGWIQRASENPWIKVSALRSALGRFAFVAGVLPHIRPLLGPLFAWTAAVGNLKKA